MIVLIDNYDSFTYNLYQMIEGRDVKVIRNDAMTADEIMALNPTGIIISPGPGVPENAGVSVELIHLAAGKVPILGVCLGHQAIAHAFGGDVIRSGSVVHGKPARIFHTRKGIFHGLSLPFSAGRYHSLIVDRKTLPKELMIEAETAEGTLMALRHATHPIYGVQFHPESILTGEGERLINRFLEECHAS